MKFFIIIFIFLIMFSFFVDSSYARTIPPSPEVFYGVFINGKTQECSVAKTEDKFLIYEYPSDFELNKTFSEYQSIGRLKKICKGIIDCELAENGNDEFCKSEYRKLVGSYEGYDKCQLTHQRCAIVNDGLLVGYLDYVTLNPSKVTLKSSAISPLSFIFFTLVLLPAFNVFIRIKKIFSNKLRNLILGLSILFWFIVILGWLYLSSF